MTTIAIVGGKLQGVESLYLTGKAGFKSLLIDRDPDVPGRKLCDRFICLDVLKYSCQFLELLEGVDFVLPALENRRVLEHLTALSKAHGFKLAFDLDAYEITSSKLISDQMMASHGIPVPRYYPEVGLPLIAKPSGMSGSAGVKKLVNQCDLLNILPIISGKDWVLQEYLQGPSYSIEIIGRPGAYRTYHITELLMDQEYDCKRVLSTPALPEEVERDFRDIAIKLGNMVQLTGIMDVEVIYDKGGLKVLEIDARMPSQTPSVVYHATGANFVSELHHLFRGDFSAPRHFSPPSYISYEHIKVEGRNVDILGEHIMTTGGFLDVRQGFLGTKEALTDWAPGKPRWIATLLQEANGLDALEKKRSQTMVALGEMQGGPIKLRDLAPEL